MALPILKYPNSILRRKAKEVKAIDRDLRALANQMIETLVLAKGYGLAAPQVGALKRVIIVDVEPDDFHVLVNPVVISVSEEKVLGIEGCLSIPGAEAEIVRPISAVVGGLTLEGKEVVLEKENLVARVLLHEIDHLNGVLFIDYLGDARRLQLLKQYERLRREKDKKPSRARPRERAKAAL